MLFLLTGDVQIGKTRWLERLVEVFAEADVTSYGVLSPGVWIDHALAQEVGVEQKEEGRFRQEGCQGEPPRRFEKIGIDTLFLPDKRRARFALRRDIAQASGLYADEDQAARAGLIWHISDGAINAVNEHFLSISRDLMNASSSGADAQGILIVDELGWLELMHDEGFVEAMRLLDQGPQEGIRDAIIVVREALLDFAEERFASLWGGCLRIDPSPEGLEKVLACVA